MKRGKVLLRQLKEHQQHRLNHISWYGNSFHADEEWLKRLQIFLKPFPWGKSYMEGGRVWAEPYIKTGEVWRRGIDDALARTRIAVLLVSRTFSLRSMKRRSWKTD